MVLALAMRLRRACWALQHRTTAAHGGAGSCRGRMYAGSLPAALGMLFPSLPVCPQPPRLHPRTTPPPTPQDGVLQLVLLDHGLYKQITDDFRLQYAALWRSLIFADADGIKRHAEAMDAGESTEVFAAMLTQKPWDQVRIWVPGADGGCASAYACVGGGGRAQGEIARLGLAGAGRGGLLLPHATRAQLHACACRTPAVLGLA